MKITASRLRKIIREELEKRENLVEFGPAYLTMVAAAAGAAKNREREREREKERERAAAAARAKKLASADSSSSSTRSNYNRLSYDEEQEIQRKRDAYAKKVRIMGFNPNDSSSVESAKKKADYDSVESIVSKIQNMEVPDDKQAVLKKAQSWVEQNLNVNSNSSTLDKIKKAVSMMPKDVKALIGTADIEALNNVRSLYDVGVERYEEYAAEAEKAAVAKKAEREKAAAEKAAAEKPKGIFGKLKKAIGMNEATLRKIVREELKKQI